MKALILAGGKGTRLCEITKNQVPKPMAKLLGKPIIEYVIDNLKQNGVYDITISVGFLSEVIKDYLKDGKDFGVNISYIEETMPLGSGGCLFFLKGKVNEDFIVCPGDALFDVNIEKMMAFHKQKGGLITLFTHPNLHPYDSDLIIADKTGLVKDLHFKNLPRDFYYKNCVNAGIGDVVLIADFVGDDGDFSAVGIFINELPQTEHIRIECFRRACPAACSPAVGMYGDDIKIFQAAQLEEFFQPFPRQHTGCAAENSGFGVGFADHICGIFDQIEIILGGGFNCSA